jgi:hypothetical protein
MVLNVAHVMMLICMETFMHVLLQCMLQRLIASNVTS